MSQRTREIADAKSHGDPGLKTMVTPCSRQPGVVQVVGSVSGPVLKNW